jgi:hypothetical protein
VRATAVIVLLVACGGHHHGPARTDDPRHLYVEITAEGSHDDALRQGASRGLATVSFVRATTHNGDLELQVEVAGLDRAGSTTVCSVKILALRLPEHDLLGIADGSGHVRGTDGRARDDCLAGVSATLVRGKVLALLQRRLAAKR